MSGSRKSRSRWSVPWLLTDASASVRGVGFPHLFRPTKVATPGCILKTAKFFRRLWNHRCNRKLPTVAIHCNVGEIGGTNMPTLAGEVAFHPHLDSNLHRTVIGPVHGRLEDDQVANPHGNKKIEMVRRGSDDVTARMTMGGKCTCNVDPVHKAAAKKRAKWVGVIGEHKFHHLGNRFRNGARVQVFSRLHVPRKSAPEKLSHPSHVLTLI